MLAAGRVAGVCLLSACSTRCLDGQPTHHYPRNLQPHQSVTCGLLLNPRDRCCTLTEHAERCPIPYHTIPYHTIPYHNSHRSYLQGHTSALSKRTPRPPFTKRMQTLYPRSPACSRTQSPQRGRPSPCGTREWQAFTHQPCFHRTKAAAEQNKAAAAAAAPQQAKAAAARNPPPGRQQAVQADSSAQGSTLCRHTATPGRQHAVQARSSAQGSSPAERPPAHRTRVSILQSGFDSCKPERERSTVQPSKPTHQVYGRGARRPVGSAGQPGTHPAAAPVQAEHAVAPALFASRFV